MYDLARLKIRAARDRDADADNMLPQCIRELGKHAVDGRLDGFDHYGNRSFHQGRLCAAKDSACHINTAAQHAVAGNIDAHHKDAVRDDRKHDRLTANISPDLVALLNEAILDQLADRPSNAGGAQPCIFDKAGPGHILPFADKMINGIQVHILDRFRILLPHSVLLQFSPYTLTLYRNHLPLARDLR